MVWDGVGWCGRSPFADATFSRAIYNSITLLGRGVGTRSGEGGEILCSVRGRRAACQKGTCVANDIFILFSKSYKGDLNYL